MVAAEVEEPARWSRRSVLEVGRRSVPWHRTRREEPLLPQRGMHPV